MQEAAGSSASQTRPRDGLFSTSHRPLTRLWGNLLPEILLRILRFLHPLDHVLRQRTFKACTLVCHSWSHVAFQALWENPVVRTCQGIAKFERLAASSWVGGTESGGTRGDRVRRLTLHGNYSADRWSLPVLVASAASCCKNLRAIIIDPHTFMPWPLPVVAQIFLKCPRLEAFDLVADIESPYATSVDFWAGLLGRSMWQALGRLRALRLRLPQDYDITGAIGTELVQWAPPPPSSALSDIEAAEKLPKLKILIGGCLDDPSLAAYAARCSLLVKVDLNQINVTDAGVKELLSRCQLIKELDLTSTLITAKTFIALKDYHPLTFLGVGNNPLLFDHSENIGQFDAELVDLIRQRGSKLTYLALGSPKFLVTAEITVALLNPSPRLLDLNIYGLYSLSYLETLARDLPSLRSLGARLSQPGSDYADDPIGSHHVLRKLEGMIPRVAFGVFIPWGKNMDGIDLEVSGICA
ncbi:hypothetical protein BDK51DRAFT_51481 [Blyttiomyces helicus]|uniref:Uncharacterized protein n=1 Tax=Blyttiomyces helicus TaxID=388810 RepID=A0A4P9WJQ5_9FUNG|nr:hypothetical protein BDK51DRAFT_51481 [Blyttiomyces helicus]|eukprot:RKO93171.1 hypothetical protein BDK51DRAFT_51481 [Blyttiomyces helicus]